MSCISHLNLCPASGDTENVLLQKILQSVNAGGGVAGVSSISVNGGAPQTGAVAISTGGTVTSVNGDPGPAVSLNSGEIPEGANLYFTNARAIASTLTGFVAAAGTVTAADSILTALQKSSGTTNDLLNFRDSNAHADASIFINSGATEIVKVIGASAFISLASERLQRNIDSGKLALLGGIAKGTGAFVEVHGDTSATVGLVAITTKGRTTGTTGFFQIFNNAIGSAAGDLRAQMGWEGSWSFTPTWNDGAVTFTGLKLNLTDTASAAASLLADLQVGAVSQWKVSKAGNTTQLGSVTASQLLLPNTTSATAGGIYFGGVRAIHNFGTTNYFAGVGAGNLTLSGSSNVGVGVSALAATTSANANTAVGAFALLSATSGGSNTAFGAAALEFNTTGGSNSAFGNSALLTNVTGSFNIAFGLNALFMNLSGANNAAFGTSALFACTGDANVGFGSSALIGVTTGSQNCAFGHQAMRSLTTASNNIAFGYRAGDNLLTGAHNIVIGNNISTPTTTSSDTLNIGNLIFGTAIDGFLTTLSTGNIAVGITTPFQKFSVLGAIGAYELATDSSNYSRTAITPAAGNHTIQTQAAGTGTLRILQVGTGPKVGTDIAGANAIFHGGQSTGAGAGGSALIQVSPAGGAGAGVNALVTRIEASNTGLGFFAVAPVAKQVSGANLTNNVTAGGTDDTIANYTDLTIYANDAAAIRNDIYQLARKLKQVNDALRLYGLLT